MFASLLFTTSASIKEFAVSSPEPRWAGEAGAPQLQDAQQPSSRAHDGGLELSHRDVAGGRRDLRPLCGAGTRRCFGAVDVVA